MGKSSSADDSMPGAIFAVSIMMLILPRATRLFQASPMSHPELPHVTPFRSEQGIAESMIRHAILPLRNGFDEHTIEHGPSSRGPSCSGLSRTSSPTAVDHLSTAMDYRSGGRWGRRYTLDVGSPTFRCKHMDLLMYHSYLADLYCTAAWRAVKKPSGPREQQWQWWQLVRSRTAEIC